MKPSGTFWQRRVRAPLVALFTQGVTPDRMALAFAAKGVNVLVVKPGFVDTPMTSAFPKGPLWASAQAVGGDIVTAVKKGKRGVIYTPFWWRFIMLVIRFAPGFVVRRI